MSAGDFVNWSDVMGFSKVVKSDLTRSVNSRHVMSVDVDNFVTIVVRAAEMSATGIHAFFAIPC